MSYESKLNSRFSQFVNPTQLSLVLSVVLHLLIYKFGLPALNFKTDSGKREVSIVELTPEQQSRVPNLYPELDTPGINNLSQNQNDAPAPPFALPPSLIPGFENFPNLPPVNIPPPPNFNFPPLPPISNNIKLPPIGNLTPLPLPPSVNPLDFKVEPLKLPPVPTKTATIKPLPGSKQPKQPATATSPQRTTKPEKLPEVKPEVKPELDPQVIAAKREKNSQTRVRSLSQSLQHQTVATTDEDARKNYLAWVSQVKEVKPENIEIKGAYPRDACIRRLEGKSIYGVVVDPQGALLGLDLLKGSEYPIFNAQAGQDISKRTLVNKTNKPKPYQVTVDYKYDAEICPSLTLPSLRRDNKPKTEPTLPTPPEAKPQPTPAAPVVPQKPPEAKPQPTPAAPVVPQKPPEAKPQPTAPTQPSLKDRLREVPLLDTKPSQLEKIPLPDKPRL
jgi:outer membrane biosynthesis protein TonB